MNNYPLVSIVMPAFNAEKYIKESIESVLNQTYTYWELLIVDDGSTDRTQEIIQKYASVHTQIKYFYQANGKQGKARNLALDNAAGELIAFLDADDLWSPKMLEFQVHEIKKRNCDLVFGGCYIFKDRDLKNNRIYNHKPGIYAGSEGLKLFIQINRIPILTVLVKKQALIKVNNFSENVAIQNCEDYHLWLKLLNAGCLFYHHKELLAYYREHDESVTANALKLFEAEIESLAEMNFHNSRVEAFKIRKVRIIYKTIFVFLVRNQLLSLIPKFILKFKERCNSTWRVRLFDLTRKLNSNLFLFVVRLTIR